MASSSLASLRNVLHPKYEKINSERADSRSLHVPKSFEDYQDPKGGIGSRGLFSRKGSLTVNNKIDQGNSHLDMWKESVIPISRKNLSRALSKKIQPDQNYEKFPMLKQNNPTQTLRDLVAKNEYIRLPVYWHEYNTEKIKKNRSNLTNKVNGRIKDKKFQSCSYDKDYAILVQKPFYSSSKGELNTVNFYSSLTDFKKSNKNETKLVKTGFYFNRDYPKARTTDIDFVKLHSEGMDNKKNTDLFKHYQRLFVKNKYWQLKEIQEKRALLKKEEERQNLKIEENNVKETKNVDYVPLKVKEIIIEKSMADINYYEKIMNVYYEQNEGLKHNKASSISPPKEQTKMNSTLISLDPEKTKMNLNNNLKEQGDDEKRNFELEEEFLKEISEKIESRSYFYVNRNQMMLFKDIVTRRKIDVDKMKTAFFEEKQRKFEEKQRKLEERQRRLQAIKEKKDEEKENIRDTFSDSLPDSDFAFENGDNLKHLNDEQERKKFKSKKTQVSKDEISAESINKLPETLKIQEQGLTSNENKDADSHLRKNLKTETANNAKVEQDFEDNSATKIENMASYEVNNTNSQNEVSVKKILNFSSNVPETPEKKDKSKKPIQGGILKRLSTKSLNDKEDKKENKSTKSENIYKKSAMFADPDPLLKNKEAELEVLKMELKNEKDDPYTWHNLWKNNKAPGSILDDLINMKKKDATTTQTEEKKTDDAMNKKLKTNPNLKRLQSKRHVNMVTGEDDDEESTDTKEIGKKFVVTAQKIDLLEKDVNEVIEDELDAMYRMKKEKKQLDALLKKKKPITIRSDSFSTSNKGANQASKNESEDSRMEMFEGMDYIIEEKRSSMQIPSKKIDGKSILKRFKSLAVNDDNFEEEQENEQVELEGKRNGQSKNKKLQLTIKDELGNPVEINDKHSTAPIIRAQGVAAPKVPSKFFTQNEANFNKENAAEAYAKPNNSIPNEKDNNFDDYEELRANDNRENNENYQGKNVKYQKSRPSFSKVFEKEKKIISGENGSNVKTEGNSYNKNTNERANSDNQSKASNSEYNPDKDLDTSFGIRAEKGNKSKNNTNKEANLKVSEKSALRTDKKKNSTRTFASSLNIGEKNRSSKKGQELLDVNSTNDPEKKNLNGKESKGKKKGKKNKKAGQGDTIKNEISINVTNIENSPTNPEELEALNALQDDHLDQLMEILEKKNNANRKPTYTNVKAFESPNNKTPAEGKILEKIETYDGKETLERKDTLDSKYNLERKDSHVTTPNMPNKNRNHSFSKEKKSPKHDGQELTSFENLLLLERSESNIEFEKNLKPPSSREINMLSPRITSVEEILALRKAGNLIALARLSSKNRGVENENQISAYDSHEKPRQSASPIDNAVTYQSGLTGSPKLEPGGQKNLGMQMVTNFIKFSNLKKNIPPITNAVRRTSNIGNNDAYQQQDESSSSPGSVQEREAVKEGENTNQEKRPKKPKNLDAWKSIKTVKNTIAVSREMKQQIEDDIEEIENMDNIDAETKFNILMYKERNDNIKKYMEEVGVQLEEKILTDQDCLDQLKILNMEKNRQLGDKEKILKLRFSFEVNNLILDRHLITQNVESLDEKDKERMYYFAKVSNDLEALIKRKKEFKRQGKMLKSIKDFVGRNLSCVNQESLKQQDTNIDEPHFPKNTTIITEGLAQDMTLQTIKTSSKHNDNLNLTKEESDLLNLASKLKKLKHKKPQSFKNFIDKVEKIKNQSVCFFKPD